MEKLQQDYEAYHDQFGVDHTEKAHSFEFVKAH